MNKLNVTVAVCTRNRPATLRDCLESLAQQDYSPELYEVLVVDDGSTDQAPVIGSEFADRTTFGDDGSDASH